MKVTATKSGVNLRLTVEEAVALEAVLGDAVGPLARELPWYDEIADVLEAKHLPSTISQAVEERFVYFRTSPTFWDDSADDFRVDNTRAVRITR